MTGTTIKSMGLLAGALLLFTAMASADLASDSGSGSPANVSVKQGLQQQLELCEADLDAATQELAPLREQIEVVEGQCAEIEAAIRRTTDDRVRRILMLMLRSREAFLAELNGEVAEVEAAIEDAESCIARVKALLIENSNNTKT